MKKEEIITNIIIAVTFPLILIAVLVMTATCVMVACDILDWVEEFYRGLF